MKILNRLVIVSILLILTSTACSESPEDKGSPEYIKQINDWHAKRIANLKKENGWLNLIGLEWLKDGDNHMGSNPANEILLPPNKVDEFVGKFVKHDSTITFFTHPGTKVLLNKEPVQKLVMIDDMHKGTTVLQHKNLKWFIIKRFPNKYGVRIRDLEAPLLKSFEGIERFPVNEDWKFNAKFVPYNPPKEISIPTAIGTVEKDFSPGRLIFTKDGKEYSLDVMNGSKSFFIVFADLTSGVETYGVGRFLYTDKPDSNSMVILDFNKAYNPPCAFTKYATCPLPPKDNYLNLRVTAGEKNYGHGH